MKELLLITSIIWGLVSCQTETKPVGEPTSVGRNYREQHRPQIHFSPAEMWMNDPNGMVFYKGEYHLFYQYYPGSTVWGPMHWGHAVSKNLINWEHLPIGLYPDSLGYIFSGSAVVDWNNTSGFGSKENPPLIAIYTVHDIGGEFSGRMDFQTQAIAYSLDRGRTWVKYAGNPVLANTGIRDFRDPKVFWHEETGKWIMILAVRDHAEFFGSEDLKSWQKLSQFGLKEGSHAGVWECPDLFQLPVDGSGHNKWVLIISLDRGGPNLGSATQYFVGDFNGIEFVNHNLPEQILWLDYGRDNYAGVTWSDVPDSDGRRLFIGWMNNWMYARYVPTDPWRSAMTIPRKLALRNTEVGIRLANEPVEEVENLRVESVSLHPQTIEGFLDITDTLGFNVGISEMELEFESFGSSTDFGVELSNAEGEKIWFGFEPRSNILYVDRTKSGKKIPGEFARRNYSPRISSQEGIKVRVLIDVSSVEVFFDDGLTVFTDTFFPNQDFDRAALFSRKGTISLRSGTVHRLKPIWD